MDGPQIWATLAIMVGSGGFLTVGIQEFAKWRSGRAESERKENLSLAERVATAEAWREWEATYRRLTAEHCSHVRRIAIEHGATIEQIGAWPTPPEKPQTNKD
ncbi:hypothetical protein [Glutamicibacter sp. AOP5-A2-18]|uniref:hypothetical protein n=1 Tax=Glutamicibacter sp. AOP5-A2-18 TaxID=3457656 RepID=UPI0040339E94